MPAFPTIDAHKRYAQKSSHSFLGQGELCADGDHSVGIQHLRNLLPVGAEVNICYNKSYMALVAPYGAPNVKQAPTSSTQMLRTDGTVFSAGPR